MTDEAKRAAADLAAEIVSADRPSAPGKDGNSEQGDYFIRAAVAIAVLMFILVPVLVVVLTHPE